MRYSRLSITRTRKGNWNPFELWRVRIIESNYRWNLTEGTEKSVRVIWRFRVMESLLYFIVFVFIRRELYHCVKIAWIRSRIFPYTVFVCLWLYMEIVCPNTVKYRTVFRRFLRCVHTVNKYIKKKNKVPFPRFSIWCYWKCLLYCIIIPVSKI